MISSFLLSMNGHHGQEQQEPNLQNMADMAANLFFGAPNAPVNVGEAAGDAASPLRKARSRYTTGSRTVTDWPFCPGGWGKM